MKPIDFRNETFEQFKERFNTVREAVYRAWVQHGPGTTRDVAAKARIDLLTFRPRTTELYQMGLVRPREGQMHQGEGIYEAVPLDQWQRWFEKQREGHISQQQQLL